MAVIDTPLGSMVVSVCLFVCVCVHVLYKYSRAVVSAGITCHTPVCAAVITLGYGL
jgi:hypothetical protein